MASIDHVLPIFGSRRKAQCFLEGAKLIKREGWKHFKKRMGRCGSGVLTELPGIGPVTKDHLAKNIGLIDTAKPDVWLIRAAKTCKASGVAELVEFLHEQTGETRHVIDVAIWTYARDGGVSTVGRE